jgi:hypothetical protein
LGFAKIPPNGFVAILNKLLSKAMLNVGSLFAKNNLNPSMTVNRLSITAQLTKY